MTDLYTLPRQAVLGDAVFDIRCAWQDALAVLQILDSDAPEWVRWFRAIDRFYVQRVPNELLGAAAAWMAEFLTAGRTDSGGVKLLDWQADAMEIIADINRVAGIEVRNTDAHWWTFLAWFHAIGEGQLSALVGLRRKLLRGEKLTAAEQEFYRQNKARVRLQSPDSTEKQKLLRRIEN